MKNLATTTVRTSGSNTTGDRRSHYVDPPGKWTATFSDGTEVINSKFGHARRGIPTHAWIVRFIKSNGKSAQEYGFSKSEFCARHSQRCFERQLGARRIVFIEIAEAKAGAAYSAAGSPVVNQPGNEAVMVT